MTTVVYADKTIGLRLVLAPAGFKLEKTEGEDWSAYIAPEESDMADALIGIFDPAVRSLLKQNAVLERKVAALQAKEGETVSEAIPEFGWFHAATKDQEAWEGPLPTRDAAISAGRGRYGQRNFLVSWGTKVDPSQWMPDAADIFEIMADRAHDDGDHEWPDLAPNSSPHIDLDLLLTEWLATWERELDTRWYEISAEHETITADQVPAQ